MERLVVMVPFTRMLLTAVFLGIGLVIGVKIGSAIIKIATPHFSKLQTRKRL